MLVAPLLLAVAALGAIRRVVLFPLAVIIRLSLTLARGPTAYRLLWMITGGREKFLTISTAGKCHMNLWHPLMGAHVCSLISADRLFAQLRFKCVAWIPQDSDVVRFASRSWSKPWRHCNTMNVGELTRAPIIVGATTTYLVSIEVSPLIRAARTNLLTGFHSERFPTSFLLRLFLLPFRPTAFWRFCFRRFPSSRTSMGSLCFSSH
jgi:hypothetical protein